MFSTPQEGKVLAIWREPFKLGSPTVEHWEPGLTVAQIVSRMTCLPPEFSVDGAVSINGEIIPREFWTVVRPKAHSVKKPVGITFQMPVHGGEGKGGIKSIFAIVAALAITVASAGAAAGSLAPLLGEAFAAGTFGAKALAAGISLVGSLVVGALSSTPARSAAENDPGGASLDAAAVSGNVLEQNVALPRVIGTRRIFPPFLAEPITEIIAQDEYISAIYGLAGPHKIEDLRLGQASVSLTDLDTDLTIEVSDGLPGNKITIPARYGRTFNISTEMSVHGTDPTNLAVFAPPTPVFHGMSTAEGPDEAWIHLLLFGLGLQDGSASLRIPFRVRMRRRGDASWRYLPELHYMDNTQSQRRFQIKFRFGEDFIGLPPIPPTNRGFVEARKVVPGQNVLPNGVQWDCDPYFSTAAGNDIYRSDTFNTTNVRRITLEADTVTVYLTEADWPSGIYDIEIIRGSPFRNDQFTSNSYVYSGNILDFYGTRASGLLPMSREGLLDRVTLTRIVSIRRQPPINQQNLAMIYLTARNRSVNNLSVKASGYVKDWGIGDDWKFSSTIATVNSWRAVAWSPSLGLFVAVSESGTGNRVMSSPDGINWTLRTSAADASWQGLAWSPSLGLFVAVGDSGTTSCVMTSPNGINWTIRTGAAALSWRAVTWSPSLGLFVAVASSGTGNRVMTSTNGTSWTARTSAANNDWRAVTWSPELSLFVAVAITGTGNRVMTSPNGITWTARNAAADVSWRGVAWSPPLELFVAVSTDGTNRVMTSPDGITWTLRKAATDDVNYIGVIWSPELSLFVAVGATNGDNRMMTSSNGIDWQISSISSPDTNFISVAWSSTLSMFVAVGGGTTGANSAAYWKGDVGWNYLTTTSNPAPHYRDILSGLLNLDPLPDDLHDDASLIDWRADCITKDYTCDLIAEGVGIAELLRIVASCGYARPYQSEIWGVIKDYDRSGEQPVQIFSYRNMQSFKWMKAFPRLPAGLRCNYKDDEFEYSGKQIVVYRQGSDESDGRTEQISYTGLVSRAKIIKRAQFDLLQGEHRSAIYNWSAPAEAIVCRRGSLVGVNHDVIQRHYGAARIASIVLNGGGALTSITLDSRVDVKNSLDMHAVTDMHAVVDMHEVGLNTAIAVRRTTGATTIHRVSNVAGETDTLTFSPAIANPVGSSSIYDSGTVYEIDEGCLITVGILGEEYSRFIVSDIQPGKNLTSTITAVNEAPQIWSNF